ncbi:MAG: DedA family protein [Neisseriales bacterium]|nr:MAG: DedA family protein [Neisseriales bacterium]
MLHELIAFFAIYGYIAVFLVLIACGFGVPIPEDITLVAGGVICGLAATMDVHLMVTIALLGVIIGDGTMFMLGKLLGPRVKKVPLLKNVFTEKRYKQMQEKVHKYGNRILFVARFLPGLRAPIFMTAGISRRVSYWKFLVMDGGAALISVPLWVYAGYYFAHDLDDLLHWVRQSETFILSILAFILLVWIIISVAKKNKIKSR